jgi:GntR family transcriptional regulator
VVERLQAIGVTVDQLTEDVSVRRCLAMEAATLRIPAGAPVLVVTREHRAGQRAVEMSEIVIPADRSTLRYRIPVGRADAAIRAGADRLAAVPAAAPAGAGLPA